MYHRGELAVRVLQQLGGAAELDLASRIQHEHAVAVDDGVEPMGNCQHRTVFELDDTRAAHVRLVYTLESNGTG